MPISDLWLNRTKPQLVFKSKKTLTGFIERGLCPAQLQHNSGNAIPSGNNLVCPMLNMLWDSWYENIYRENFSISCAISYNCSVHGCEVISSETPQHFMKRKFQVNIFIQGQFFVCRQDDYTASSVGLCNFIISDIYVIHVCYYWIVRSQPAEVKEVRLQKSSNPYYHILKVSNQIFCKVIRVVNLLGARGL